MSLEITITIDFLHIFRCSKSIQGQYYERTANGSLQECLIDPQTSLPTEGCMFFPDRNQNTNSSIMFLPSLDSASTDFTCFHTFRKIILVTSNLQLTVHEF